MGLVLHTHGYTVWEGLHLPTKMGAVVGGRKMDVGRNRWYIPPEQLEVKTSLLLARPLWVASG